ncbi:MAG: cation-translocating P-type ATPase [Patescibacteria group bacterium]
MRVPFGKLLLKGELPLWLDVVFISLTTALLIVRYGNFFEVETVNPYLIVVSIIANIPVLIATIRSLREKRISADLLAGIALVFSFLAREWASAAFITLMLAFARMLRTWSDARADRALSHLAKLKPKYAKVRHGNNITEIPINKVKLGDTVVVSVGENVPVDGKILEGEGLLNQSSITGESVPVYKKEGDKVISGSIVVQGSFEIVAQKVGKYSTIEKIISLVESAGERKAPIIKIADRLSAYYITVAFIVSIVVYALSQDTSLVLSILLVVCADEIAVAIPLAFLMAVAVSAKKGVIIRGVEFLEGFSRLKTLIVDKTGTLTTGKLSVAGCVMGKGVSSEDFFEASLLTSSVSKHPASKAIEKYISKFTKAKSPSSFEEKVGKGIISRLEGEHFFLGRRSFMEEMHAPLSKDLLERMREAEMLGFNITYVGKNKNTLGFFIVADELKKNIKTDIDHLKALGVLEIVMLTGDNAMVAHRIGLEAGVTQVRANLLPEDKVKEVEKFLHKMPDKILAVVGDGVNDAAALKRAPIGIVMGALGSDVSIEAADVILMHDDFSKIPETIDLSRFVMKIARQNFVWWIIINAVGLYFVFTHVLNPTSAAAFNFLTDFIPLFNALRVMGFKRSVILN